MAAFAAFAMKSTSNGNFLRQIRILLVSIVHRCQCNLLKLGLNKGKDGSDIRHVAGNFA